MHLEDLCRVVVVPMAQLDAVGAGIGDAPGRAAERNVAVFRAHPVDAVPVPALHGVHVTVEN